MRQLMSLAETHVPTKKNTREMNTEQTLQAPSIPFPPNFPDRMSKTRNAFSSELFTKARD
jgi:hypothetical protein